MYSSRRTFLYATRANRSYGYGVTACQRLQNKSERGGESQPRSTVCCSGYCSSGGISRAPTRFLARVRWQGRGDDRRRPDPSGSGPGRAAPRSGRPGGEVGAGEVVRARRPASARVRSQWPATAGGGRTRGGRRGAGGARRRWAARAQALGGRLPARRASRRGCRRLPHGGCSLDQGGVRRRHEEF